MIDDLVIEKDIPLPSINRRPKNALAEVADKMEVGDSIFFYEQVMMLRFKRSADHLYAGKKFTSRKLTEGYRVWRVK